MLNRCSLCRFYDMVLHNLTFVNTIYNIITNYIKNTHKNKELERKLKIQSNECFVQKPDL